MKKISIGIIGASGFTGQELTLLLSQEKNVDILFVQSRSQAGVQCPYSDLKYEDISDEEMIEKKPNCVFFCTPNGTAMHRAKKFVDKEVKVIDLSADFRFSDVRIFEKTYGMKFPVEMYGGTHKQGIIANRGVSQSSVLANKGACPLVPTDNKNSKNISIAYGLPEFFPKRISKADIIANPGCYVTSALIATYPIKHMIERVIFDGKSGYSGAGVQKEQELKNLLEQNFYSYKITAHRHEAEIQQFFDIPVSFTPHLLPFFRGIETTCHIFLKEEFRDRDFVEYFREYYQSNGKIHPSLLSTNNEVSQSSLTAKKGACQSSSAANKGACPLVPMNKKNNNLSHQIVKIQKEIPQISQVQNTNNIILGGFEVDHNNRLVISSVEDNLRKGAASQALQNFHLMFSS